MIFARRNNEFGRNLSVKRVRGSVLGALTFYPVGALVQTYVGDARPERFVHSIGHAMTIAGVALGATVLTTSIQRIVGEQASKLDEFELKLRSRAMSSAYMVFTFAAMLMVLYAGIAVDAGLWLPRTFGEIMALFWGVLLYATLLPTLFLVCDPRNASELADIDAGDR